MDGIIKCLENSNKTKGEVFNIGAEKNYQVKNLINTIKKKIASGSPQFGRIPLRIDEKINFYPSIKKVKKMLNWKPKINWKRALD